jgi:hypothetical protein
MNTLIDHDLNIPPILVSSNCYDLKRCLASLNAKLSLQFIPTSSRYVSISFGLRFSRRPQGMGRC